MILHIQLQIQENFKKKNWISRNGDPFFEFKKYLFMKK